MSESPPFSKSIYENKQTKHVPVAMVSFRRHNRISIQRQV